MCLFSIISFKSLTFGPTYFTKMDKKAFSLVPTRGSVPGPRWGLRPGMRVIRSRSPLANHGSATAYCDLFVFCAFVYVHHWRIQQNNPAMAPSVRQSGHKIGKIGATSCQILRLKCSKFDFRWDSAPDPAEGAYSAPQTPSWI